MLRFTAFHAVPFHCNSSMTRVLRPRDEIVGALYARLPTQWNGPDFTIFSPARSAACAPAWIRVCVRPRPGRSRPVERSRAAVRRRYGRWDCRLLRLGEPAGGVGADDAVDCDARRGLEPPHGLDGVRAEPAVDRAGIAAERVQLALQHLDPRGVARARLGLRRRGQRRPQDRSECCHRDDSRATHQPTRHQNPPAPSARAATYRTSRAPCYCPLISENDASIGAVVVGTGFGVLTHLRALRAAGIDVLALVGRDAAKTADRAERFDVPHALTSARAKRSRSPASTSSRWPRRRTRTPRSCWRRSRPAST